MLETEQIKRPRGNPAFQKKKQDNNTNNTMPDDKKEVDEKGEEVKKETPPAETTPPAPDTLPSDLFSDKIPGEESIPMDGQTKEKPYAALPVDASESTASSNGTATPPSGDTIAPAPAVVTPPPTPEEIQSQATQSADLMIRGYEKLHMLGRWVGKVDQNDLTQMHAKGKINLEQVLPLGKKSITVQDFFSEYNQGIDENIVVSQEFKDNIRPPLIRECIRRGWLMIDLTYILVMTGEDLTTKMSMLVGLKRSANLVLNACQEMMKNQRTQSEPKRTPPIQKNQEQEHPPTEEIVDWHEVEPTKQP